MARGLRLVLFAFTLAASTAVPGRAQGPIPDPILPGTVQVKLEVVATGLAAPNWGTFAPGLPDNVLFVTDQNGTLWQVDVTTGQKRVFLDVAARLVGLGPFDERGLLGLAFHPDYAANGLFYTYTSEPVAGGADFSTMPPGVPADHQSVILEWQATDPGDPLTDVDPVSAREVLRIDQPQPNHNGGGLAFGPDDFLYVSLGDGGGSEDEGVGHRGPRGNGQNPLNVLGTILRIDPDGADSANGSYGIPPDNPFVARPRLAAEIFAFGFRNPFRFSFDSVTGTLVAGDVGQNDIEEVNVVRGGRDYGWNFKEGTFCFEPNGSDPGFIFPCSPDGVLRFLTDPVAQYDHDEGRAVIGGFVYRGAQIPELQGRYVFGDYSQGLLGGGRLFYFEGGQILELGIAGQPSLDLFLLGFGRDAAGELYVLAGSSVTPSGGSGVVLRIAPGDTPNIVDSNIENFTLEDLTIPVGTTVRWRNLDTAPHTSTSGQSPVADGIWDSGLLAQGETFSYTFDQAGTFPYFCIPHPFMTATVTVNPE